MSTQTTEPTPTDERDDVGAGGRLTVYGDFTCPWSYLSWRRSELLRADGVEVDWRSVEHDPWHHQDEHEAVRRHHTTSAALGGAESHLLPRERLPHAFTGPVPFTGAATAAYAEAVVAGVGAEARRILFEAFWLHGADLNNARTVRDALAGVLRGRPSRSELVRLWGYGVDVTGGPVTAEAWRLVRDWRAHWQGLGEGVVPALSLDARTWVHGEDVVDRLRDELTARGLEVDASAA